MLDPCVVQRNVHRAHHDIHLIFQARRCLDVQMTTNSVLLAKVGPSCWAWSSPVTTGASLPKQSISAP